MVDNEPGVLARLVGLFSGRGYNIESLSVSEVDSDKFLSRVTIVTSGTKIIIDQIKAQLKKLIPVHNLIDISELKTFIGKELILIKLNVKKKQVSKIFNLVKENEAEILFNNKAEVIIQYSGTPSEISSMIKKFRPYNIVEQTRSGLVSMALGTKYIRK
jgi:acetolactate synthase-1/3 small subunit